MTFKEWADSKYGETTGFSLGMIEEYAKLRASEAARRAAEYVWDLKFPLSEEGGVLHHEPSINAAIQHAISEGTK